MGSTTLYQVLMMVLTVCVWRGVCGWMRPVSNTPSWPTTGCTITRHQGMTPTGGWYTSTFTLTSQDECESLCLSEARCGSYAWVTGRQWCSLYQHTPRLMEDLTGIPQEAWRRSDSGYNMGSKDCDAIISPTVCGNYIGHDRKYPDWKYYVARVSQYPTRPLTAAMCQSICDAHEACQSVWYGTRSSGSSVCTLYNTTITELIDSGRENEIGTNDNTVTHPVHITYDCDIRTTPQIDCTNLTGATLCLPIGQGDEATCQAIPGCCFLEFTIAGASYTMCMKAD